MLFAIALCVALAPPPLPFPVPLFPHNTTGLSLSAKASLHVQVMRRYHIQDRDDYKKYNKLCGEVTHLVSLLKRLDARDSARIELTDQLLDK